jgi:NADH-quinone oxidoreductase subunit N
MEAIIILFLTGIIALFLGILKQPKLTTISSILGLISAGIVQYFPLDILSDKYNILKFGDAGNAFVILALLITGLIILTGDKGFQEDETHVGDYHALLLFSLSGGVILLGFQDIFMFFLGLEILSIPLYVLAGAKRQSKESSEAAVKYFFMGAFATCLLLFGVALVYGSTQSFELERILEFTAKNPAGPMFYVGLLFILASFLFKVGAAPFHFWVPDVYQGSPTVFMGYMSSVVKLVGVFAFVKFFHIAFVNVHEFWTILIAVLITVSMFVGNLSALVQTKFKRLLAYSSITNGSYALMSILYPGSVQDSSLWIFMVGYGLSVVALITISSIVNDESDEISSLKGIGYKNPLIGLVAIVALLSTSSIPPFTGFYGKLMIFSSVWTNYPWLIILALINSAIGVYIYLRLIMTILSKENSETTSKLSIPILQQVVLISSLLILTFGWIFLACWK